MRVVLDTNILVSALMVQLDHPAAIYRAWEEGYFTLLICAEQLEELRATLHKPAIAQRIKPYNAAGRLVNQLKKLAEDIGPLPAVKRSPDPTDDFLLALSEAGKADYLVTGDTSGLLDLNPASCHAHRVCAKICRAACMNLPKRAPSPHPACRPARPYKRKRSFLPGPCFRRTRLNWFLCRKRIRRQNSSGRIVHTAQTVPGQRKHPLASLKK